mmetsp:Transcript_43461/g.114678  ORF Transcript_43461/g.114678 Transcript_43461/m.114678 type:complete len:537 (-) Transcript_43461:52-1662(-)
MRVRGVPKRLLSLRWQLTLAISSPWCLVIELSCMPATTLCEPTVRSHACCSLPSDCSGHFAGRAPVSHPRRPAWLAADNRFLHALKAKCQSLQRSGSVLESKSASAVQTAVNLEQAGIRNCVSQAQAGIAMIARMQLQPEDHHNLWILMKSWVEQRGGSITSVGLDNGRWLATEDIPAGSTAMSIPRRAFLTFDARPAVVEAVDAVLGKRASDALPRQFLALSVVVLLEMVSDHSDFAQYLQALGWTPPRNFFGLDLHLKKLLRFTTAAHSLRSLWHMETKLPEVLRMLSVNATADEITWALATTSARAVRSEGSLMLRPMLDMLTKHGAPNAKIIPETKMPQGVAVVAGKDIRSGSPLTVPWPPMNDASLVALYGEAPEQNPVGLVLKWTTPIPAPTPALSGYGCSVSLSDYSSVRLPPEPSVEALLTAVRCHRIVHYPQSEAALAFGDGHFDGTSSRPRRAWVQEDINVFTALLQACASLLPAESQQTMLDQAPSGDEGSARVVRAAQRDLATVRSCVSGFHHLVSMAEGGVLR